MIVVIGEVLLDIFPHTQRLGGAPYNVACHLKALGQNVRFFSRVGRDDAGALILKDLAQRGFDTDDIQVDASAATGRVLVDIHAEGEPRFNIQTHAAYDFLEGSERLDQVLSDRLELVYVGSVIQRTRPVSRLVQQLLQRCPTDCCRFFDVNLRPGTWNLDVIRECVETSDVVKLSEGELELLARLWPFKSRDLIEELMQRHGLKAVCITRGARGSVLRSCRGDAEADSRPPARMVDSVGAGDAFAAVLALGWIRGTAPEALLKHATYLGSRVCEERGALFQDVTAYELILQGMKGQTPI